MIANGLLRSLIAETLYRETREETRGIEFCRLSEGSTAHPPYFGISVLRAKNEKVGNESAGRTSNPIENRDNYGNWLRINVHCMRHRATTVGRVISSASILATMSVSVAANAMLRIINERTRQPFQSNQRQFSVVGLTAPLD